jgi:hypothetical protein
MPGDQPRQDGEPQLPGRLVADPADLAAQHRVLVPEHQELGILGHPTPGQHHRADEETVHEQADDSEVHSAMIPTLQAAQPDPVIEPHKFPPAGPSHPHRPPMQARPGQAGPVMRCFSRDRSWALAALIIGGKQGAATSRGPSDHAGPEGPRPGSSERGGQGGTRSRATASGGRLLGRRGGHRHGHRRNWMRLPRPAWPGG